MSQTKQQEQGAAEVKPSPRRHWEMFWRIIAGLMLLVIAWVVWVLYQITPRSVVTPLAYANKVRPIGAQQPPAGAPAIVPAAPPSAAAAAAADQAQAAARSGAHQSSAEVQAAAREPEQEQKIKGEGLRLATELSMPPAEKPSIPKAREEKSGGAPAVPAATGAAGKDRP